MQAAEGGLSSRTFEWSDGKRSHIFIDCRFFSRISLTIFRFFTPNSCIYVWLAFHAAKFMPIKLNICFSSNCFANPWFSKCSREWSWYIVELEPSSFAFALCAHAELMFRWIFFTNIKAYKHCFCFINKALIMSIGRFRFRFPIITNKRFIFLIELVY